MNDNLNDLDLEAKIYEAKMKAFDEDLAELQNKHQITLMAVNMADPSGLVRPVILKQELAAKTEK